MARIGLIDVDSKIPNAALMRLSAYHKAAGDTVVLNDFSVAEVDKVYASVVFSVNRARAEQLRNLYPNVEIGGTGYSLASKLPCEVEQMRPDYSLYSPEAMYQRLRGKGAKTSAQHRARAQELVDSGIGHTSRGCVRTCEFCVIPKAAAEGRLREVATLRDLVNPRSNKVVLLDNNLTADPNGVNKLREAARLGLELNLTQGLDVRVLNGDFARALAKVKLRGGTVYYAWDLPEQEAQVMRGIDVLSQHVRPYRHRCYVLVGWRSTFEEDMYRLKRLWKAKILPYVMVYRDPNKPAGPVDRRLHHLKRWANVPGLFKNVPWSEYQPWVRDRAAYFGGQRQQELPLVA